MSGESVKNRFEQAGTDRDNKLILEGSVEDENGLSLKKIYLTVKMTDISTAGDVFIPMPVAGTVSKLYSVIDGAIINANAVITPSIDGIDITNGVITIAFSGSDAGIVDSSTPTADNVVTAGTFIRLETDGGSTNTVAAVFTIEITL